jgi:hypothetical protein
MANQTLRALAKGYADDSLDKESYRKARAELIQGIISKKIPLAEIDYPPLVQPPEPEALDDTQQRKNESKKQPAAEKAKPQTPASAKSEEAKPSNDVSTVDDSEGSNKILFIGLGLTVIAIIIVAVIALTGDSSKKTTVARTTAANDKPGGTAVVATKTKAQELIREFLNKKNWSSSTLEYFQQQWADLPADDIQTSKDSLEMGQLTNAIYKQLLEEQALSGLVDDDSSLNKQRLLVQFATEFGIDDARISLPDDIESMSDAIQEEQP